MLKFTYKYPDTWPFKGIESLDNKALPNSFFNFSFFKQASTTLQSYSTKKSSIFTELDFEEISSNRLTLMNLILFCTLDCFYEEYDDVYL